MPNWRASPPERSDILLTRDRGLLKHSAVTRGYWLRETDSRRQAAEVVNRFDLARSLRPFTRCMACNESLRPVSKSDVLDRVPQPDRRTPRRLPRMPRLPPSLLGRFALPPHAPLDRGIVTLRLVGRTSRSARVPLDSPLCFSPLIRKPQIRPVPAQYRRKRLPPLLPIVHRPSTRPRAPLQPQTPSAPNNQIALALSRILNKASRSRARRARLIDPGNLAPLVASPNEPASPSEPEYGTEKSARPPPDNSGFPESEQTPAFVKP